MCALLGARAPVARRVISGLFIGRCFKAEFSEALESSSKVIAQPLVSLGALE